MDRPHSVTELYNMHLESHNNMKGLKRRSMSLCDDLMCHDLTMNPVKMTTVTCPDIQANRYMALKLYFMNF